MTAPAGCLLELVRPVRDLARARAFYAQALGFAEVPTTPADRDTCRALAPAWDAPPSALLRLRLGGQTLVLAACDPAPQPPDDGADDPRFQHIAIVASDIAAAWQRLQAHGPVAAIGSGGPQRLPAGAGGVTAVKFRDPDGHPVELLAFAADAVPPRWSPALHGGAGPTLGIDHSAITVSDADTAIAFYRDRLGLALQARQTNTGPQQARLDGLAAPVVDVVALAPRQPSPHLELLGYRPARPAALPPVGPRTTTVWRGTGAAGLTADPDGHLHLVLPAATDDDAVAGTPAAPPPIRHP